MAELSRDTEIWAEWAAENKGPRIMAICWTITAFSCLFACGRLYVRGFMQHRLRSDDYLILVSVVGFVSSALGEGGATGVLSCALTAQATQHGFGRHFAALSAAEQTRSTIWTLAAFCPGVMSFAFPKLAVVALLTRLLLPGARHRRFLWALGLLVQLVLFATVGVLVGRCWPVAYLWDKSLGGTCFDVDIQIAYCLFAGVFSAFVDLYLAAYPSVVLWQLQMPLRQKAILSGDLGLGAMSGAVAIYKTIQIPSLGDPDFTYATADLQTWTVLPIRKIEGSSIVMAASIPVLQPLMERLFGTTVQGSSSRARRYRGQFSNRARMPTAVARRRRRAQADLDMTTTAADPAADAGDSQVDILAKASEDDEVRLSSRRPDIPTAEMSGSRTLMGEVDSGFMKHGASY